MVSARLDRLWYDLITYNASELLPGLGDTFHDDLVFSKFSPGHTAWTASGTWPARHARHDYYSQVESSQSSALLVSGITNTQFMNDEAVSEYVLRMANHSRT